MNTREGQYATAGPGPGNQDPLILLGEINRSTSGGYRRDEIDRVALGQGAIVSPRGNSGRRIGRASSGGAARHAQAKPHHSSQERVDVRVLQLIYALPANASAFFVGQQVDAYVPARTAS